MSDDRSWWQFRTQRAETDLSDKKATLKSEHDDRDAAEAEKDRAVAAGDKPGEAKAKDEQEKHERGVKDLKAQVGKAGEELEMSRDGEAKAFSEEQLKLAGAGETPGPTSSTEMNAPQAEGGGYRVENPLNPGSFMEKPQSPNAGTGSTAQPQPETNSSPQPDWAAEINRDELKFVRATIQIHGGAQHLPTRDAPPVQAVGDRPRTVGETVQNAGVSTWDADRKQPPQPAMTPDEVQAKLGQSFAEAREAGRQIAQHQEPVPQPTPEPTPEP